MLVVVDESYDRTLQLNGTTFECQLQNEGQLCKRCEEYEGGPKHQRKMQLDQLYSFDAGLQKDEIKSLCTMFTLNSARVSKNVKGQAQFALFQEGEQVRVQLPGSSESCVISSAAKDVFNAVYFTPTGVVVDVGLGQVCNFIRTLCQQQKQTTLHSCYNERPDKNLMTVVVADAQQRACMGLANKGAVFVQGLELDIDVVKRVFADAAVEKNEHRKVNIMVQ